MISNKDIYDLAVSIIDSEDENTDIFERDLKIIELLFKECEITVPEENRFFVRVDCRDLTTYALCERISKYLHKIADAGLNTGMDALAYTGGCDFGHTSAHWESVITLGIYGLRCRIAEYAESSSMENSRFYNYLLKVYDGALEFMKRCAEAAKKAGKTEMSSSLISLTQRPPETLYEAMQTSFVYYSLQHFFDGTLLRTLGRVDKLFYPYFIKENTDTATELVYAYLKEANSYKATANLPLAIGGTDNDGNTLVNELSHIFVNAYKELDTTDVKLHLLVSDTMPDSLLYSALDGVRHGKNSIVFMSDPIIIKGLEKLGETHSDAVNYHVVGCYECGGEGELTCSCTARVNIPMALELALNGGRNMQTNTHIGLENNGCFPTFHSLYNEFLRQLAHLCRLAMRVTDISEADYNKIHSAPIMTATFEHCLREGKELYTEQGAKYNNSSLNALGLATAVDSLAVIRKAVFEEGLITLGELVDILKNDWKDNEALRLTFKNKYPHYGTADKAVDTLAKDIAEKLAEYVSGQPNSKGGVYRLGLFSINWRHDFGKKTAASADGRKNGDPLSQNSTASFGADTQGATSHLISASSVDAVNTPNGHIVDLDLHSSAVKGENGLNAMASALKAYFSMGGFGVHYNVLDTEVLKDARLNPEKYPNLQVRLCGWNVLFSSLSDREKDEFISRSMKG